MKGIRLRVYVAFAVAFWAILKAGLSLVCIWLKCEFSKHADANAYNSATQKVVRGCSTQVLEAAKSHLGMKFIIRNKVSWYDKNCVVVANHVNALDGFIINALVLPALGVPNITVVASGKARFWPIINIGIKMLGGLFINRSKGNRSVDQIGVWARNLPKQFVDPFAVLIFPESTRLKETPAEYADRFTNVLPPRHRGSGALYSADMTRPFVFVAMDYGPVDGKRGVGGAAQLLNRTVYVTFWSVQLAADTDAGFKAVFLREWKVLDDNLTQTRQEAREDSLRRARVADAVFKALLSHGDRPLGEAKGIAELAERRGK